MIATIIFGVSCAFIVALFGVKFIETEREIIFLPQLRRSADAHALALKGFLVSARIKISRIPPLALLIARFFVREGALRFAGLARKVEDQSHKLADMVSYKRNFERRAPRSEFLKQVTEHKNGEGKLES